MSEQPQQPDPAAAPSVTRLIPDLDDELVAALWRIEELLLTLATCGPRTTRTARSSYPLRWPGGWRSTRCTASRTS